MPKKLKVSPNQRVDIPDFFRAANEYTSETAAAHAQKVIIGDRGHVLEGFRLQIVNDPGNPAKVIVYNGNALNPDGTRLHNEADPAYAQEVTLTGASTTFFLEVVFEENDSDEDSRAFWDPTVDNTAPIPDGREFPAPIVTRITPTWRVVRPVSTNGFEYSVVTPDSIKIPLVRLTTEGDNTIIGASNPGLTTDYPATVTESDMDLAVNPTILQVADARLFSDSTDNAVTINPDNLNGLISEAAVVSFADRANNRLVLSVPVAQAFPAGTVVQATGRTQEFVVERTSGLLAANQGFPAPGTSTHPDNTSRLFQGSEIRGSGLSVYKEDGALRSDLNIRTMKDQIDFLSAQLHEMKWGSLRVGDDGVEDSRVPPSTFDLVNSPPRYYDKTRSIQGAGAFAYTVGNGTTSYGDFNAADETAIQAAINAADAGDTIYIKGGSYVLLNPITVTKALTFIGDGDTNTNISTVTAGVTMFTCSGAEQLHWSRMTLFANNDVGIAIQVTDTATDILSVENCTVAGDIDPGTDYLRLVRVSNSRLLTTTTVTTHVMVGNATGITAGRLILEGNFYQISAQNAVVVRALNVDVFSATNSDVLDLSTTATQGSRFLDLMANVSIRTGELSNTRIFGNTITTMRLVHCGAGFGVDTLVIDGMTMDNPGVLDSANGEPRFGIVKVDSFVNLDIRNVFFLDDVQTDVATAASAHLFLLANDTTHAGTLTGLPKNVSLHNVIGGYMASVTPGTGILVGDTGALSDVPVRATITGTHVSNALIGMVVATPGSALIDGCTVDGGGGSSGCLTGISLANTSNTVRAEWAVRDTKVSNIEFLNGTVLSGMTVTGFFAQYDIEIDGCHFSNIGDSAAVTTAQVYGVFVVDGNANKVRITDNSFVSMQGPGTTAASPVYVSAGPSTIIDSSSMIVAGNDIFNIGTNANVCAGITFNPSLVGGSSITNVVVENNHISEIQTQSPANYGILFRGEGGSANHVFIKNNTVVGISNVLPAAAGAAIRVAADNMTDISIADNTCFQQSSLLLPDGVRTPIEVALTEVLDGGLCSNLTIRNNNVRSEALTLTATGIQVTGLAGSVAGTYSTYEHTVISGNHIETNSTHPGAGLLLVSGFLRHTRIVDNSIAALNPGANTWAVTVNGQDVTESEFLTLRGNTVEVPSWAGAAFVSSVSLSNLQSFTMNDNVIDVENTNAVNGKTVEFSDCRKGTLNANIIQAYNLTTSVVEFDVNCEKIYGSGNVFGGLANPVIVGTDTLRGVIVPEGTATALDAIASNMVI